MVTTNKWFYSENTNEKGQDYIYLFATLWTDPIQLKIPFTKNEKPAVQKDRMDKLLDRERPTLEDSSVATTSSERVFYLEEDDTLIDLTNNSEINTNDSKNTEKKKYRKSEYLQKRKKEKKSNLLSINELNSR